MINGGIERITLHRPRRANAPAAAKLSGGAKDHPVIESEGNCPQQSPACQAKDSLARTREAMNHAGRLGAPRLPRVPFWPHVASADRRTTDRRLQDVAPVAAASAPNTLVGSLCIAPSYRVGLSGVRAARARQRAALGSRGAISGQNEKGPFGEVEAMRGDPARHFCIFGPPNFRFV